MIAGNFKGKFSGVGNHCMLSVPTIIVGTNYEARSLAAGTALRSSSSSRKPLWVTLELNE